jgi:type I restriction enzyme S subunit
VGKGKREEERGMIAAKNAKVDWKTVKLGEVCELVIDHRGKTPKKLGGDWAKEGYRALSAKSVKTRQIVNEESIHLVSQEMYSRWMKEEIQRGDILVTSEAPYGEVFYWNSDEKIVLSQRLFGLRIKQGFDSGFVAQYMTSAIFRKEMDARATGTTVFGLRQPELLDCPISLPPLPTQRKIAAVLGALDDKIENNRKICANLEAQAQALFKSWFVDFEPWGGSGFKNSEIGKIPVGWSVFKLGDFLPIKTGKKDANVADTQGKYPFFSCSQNVLWTDDYSFDGRAILVAGNGDFNVKRCDGKFEAYQRTYVLMPYKEFLAGWLYYVVKYNLEKITMSAQGSVIKFITKGHLEDFKFAAPSIVEEKENEDTRIFNEINSVIDSRIEENYRLVELRDALLPKLMSGELDVDDVEV